MLIKIQPGEAELKFKFAGIDVFVKGDFEVNQSFDQISYTGDRYNLEFNENMELCIELTPELVGKIVEESQKLNFNAPKINQASNK